MKRSAVTGYVIVVISASFGGHGEKRPYDFA